SRRRGREGEGPRRAALRRPEELLAEAPNAAPDLDAPVGSGQNFSMVGLRVATAGAVLAAVALVSGRADACVTPPPKPALVGTPAEGEQNVPTDVIPVFSYTDANFLTEETLNQAEFEFVSATGSVSATARPKYTW